MSLNTDKNTPPLFARNVIFALGLVSIVSFVAYVVLSAYAADIDPGQDGDEHALSRSAVGYAGIVKLINDMSPGAAILSRGDEEYYRRGLNIVTLERWQAFHEDDYYNFIEPILVVLPKWNTVKSDDRRGWINLPPETDFRGNPVDHTLIDRNQITLFADGDISIDVKQSETSETVTLLRDPDISNNFDLANTNLYNVDLLRHEIDQPIRRLQSVSSVELNSIIIDVKGRTLVAQVSGTDIYILSEPDLLNNHGLADISRARFSLELINGLKHNDLPAFFDLTKHGFQRTRNMMKLAFEPPFGAATLTTFIAALILAWRSSIRFGPARREQRAYALGKRALADNSASLIRMAGREHRYAQRYAALMKRLAARNAGAPRELQNDALDRFLDRFLAARRKCNYDTVEELRNNATTTDNRHSLILIARRLYNWKQEFNRERR